MIDTGSGVSSFPFYPTPRRTSLVLTRGLRKLLFFVCYRFHFQFPEPNFTPFPLASVTDNQVKLWSYYFLSNGGTFVPTSLIAPIFPLYESRPGIPNCYRRLSSKERLRFCIERTHLCLWRFSTGVGWAVTTNRVDHVADGGPQGSTVQFELIKSFASPSIESMLWY